MLCIHLFLGKIWHVYKSVINYNDYENMESKIQLVLRPLNFIEFFFEGRKFSYE